MNDSCNQGGESRKRLKIEIPDMSIIMTAGVKKTISEKTERSVTLHGHMTVAL